MVCVSTSDQGPTQRCRLYSIHPQRLPSMLPTTSLAARNPNSLRAVPPSVFCTAALWQCIQLDRFLSCLAKVLDWRRTALVWSYNCADSSHQPRQQGLCRKLFCKHESATCLHYQFGYFAAVCGLLFALCHLVKTAVFLSTGPLGVICMWNSGFLLHCF